MYSTVIPALKKNI